MTALVFFETGFDLAFLLVWLAFGWIGVVFVPYRLLVRRWQESIAIDRQAIVHAYSGLLAPRPKSIPLASIAAIAIGRHNEESISPLAIQFPRGERMLSHPEIIGFWLSAELQQQLFEAIQAFVEAHAIPLRMQRIR